MLSHYKPSILAISIFNSHQYNVRQAQAHQPLQESYQDASSGQEIQSYHLQVVHITYLHLVRSFNESNIIHRITDIIISGLCRKSGLFEKLTGNCRPFLRGPHWDGLHCTLDQEADAFLVLDVIRRQRFLAAKEQL